MDFTDPQTGPPSRGDRISRNIAAMRSQGASEHDVEVYLTEHEGLKPTATAAPAASVAPSRPAVPAVAGESTRALPFNRADKNVNLGGMPDDVLKTVLGTGASLVRDIPGAEAAQAGIRSFVRRQPYREALSDIHGAEDAAGSLGTMARVAGGGLAAAALPGSPAMQGLAYGATKGLLQSNPDAGLAERGKDAAIEGVVGAGIGKVAETLGTAIRALKAKPLGAQEIAHTARIKAADAANYGAAAREGDAAMQGTVPTSSKTLSVRDEAGRLRRNLSDVSDAELQKEYARLSELHASEEAAHGAIQESGYRGDYSELPRTERLGKKGQEDLPDADGEMDPDILAGHNKVVADYNRSQVVRNARAAAIKRLETELDQRPSAADFDFGANIVSPKSVTPIGQALNAKDVKPYADMVRGSRQFANADDATVARETYKLMSKQEGGLLRRLNTQGFDAQLDLQRQNIKLAKDELLAAAKTVMPSLPNAIATHSNLAGERDAMRGGADAARRIINGSKIAGNRLRTQSPEAVQTALAGLAPNDAQAATEGMLGRARESFALSPNPLTGFGAVPSVVRMNRVAPFLRTLDQGTQTFFPRTVNAGLLAAGIPNP